jgi:uncharacterized membrane protein YkvA (DUF1232 family)
MKNKATNEKEVSAAAPDWYTMWRSKIQVWVNQHTDDDMARIVMIVPDMFMLVVRLMRDRRVPIMLKGQLVLAAAYVLSPMDLIPEAVLGPIGLADDAGVMALVLLGIQRIATLPPTLLREHWAGDEDPQQLIESVHKRVKKHLNSDIWEKIQAKFGGQKREGKKRITIS